MTTAISPQEFVAKWRHASLKESAAYQEHFADLCRLLGHPTPAEADPAGKWFTFQAGAGKVAGGQGWADVWKMGYFGWEYKSRSADLAKAYQQLLQYREALFNPPLLIVSDFARIIIHTNFTNTVKRVYELTLDDLLIPEKLAILRHAFDRSGRAALAADRQPGHRGGGARSSPGWRSSCASTAPSRTRPRTSSSACSSASLPRTWASCPTDSSPGWSRSRTGPRKAFTEQLRQLFAAMATGGSFGVDEITHVDGGLFDDDAALDLDSDGLHDPGRGEQPGLVGHPAFDLRHAVRARAWTPTSARSSARTTPARRTSC